MSRLSLNTKMSLVVSLLLGGGLCVLTLGISWYLEDQYRGAISRQQYGVASAMAEEIDGRIQGIHAQLVALAGSVPPEMLKDSRRAQQFLAQQPDIMVPFDNGMIVFDGAGRLLAITPFEKGLVGKDYTFREYFRRTQATGRPCISDPVLSTQSHAHPILVLTAPVLDPKGKVIGVLAGSLDLSKDNFLGRLAHIRVGGGGYLYLFLRNGTMIVHSDPSRIMKGPPPSGRNRMFQKAIAGFEGTGETLSARGVPLLSSFKRLKSADWVLAVNYPQAEAYAQLDRAKWYLLEGFLAVLLLSLSVTWFFMRQLTAPLARFIGHMERITGREPEPITVETGDEIGTLAGAFNRMVEEVHRQREAVQQQKVFSENLVQNFSIPTFVLDGEHRVIIWNLACEELTGVAASRVLGTEEHWIAFHPEKRLLLADLVIDQGSGEISASYGAPAAPTPLGLHAEAWHRLGEGPERFLVLDAAPVRDAQGRLVAVVETLQDLTERKQGEEELRRATAAAESACVAKSDFLANMSHEIRTPMNATLGMLYLLQQTSLDSTQKGYLVKAQAASSQLLRVINDILDFSKIEAGQMEMECVTFRLATVMRDLVSVASAGIQEKPITLSVSVANDVPEILVGDPVRLGQILLNLTNNAVKFTDSGKVEVAVDRIGCRGTEVELSFSVTDSGIGISAEQQHHLFSAFYQGESHTTRRYGGTGLGLAICKQLVELMGGAISVESEKGKGSCFRFQLRLEFRTLEEGRQPPPIEELPPACLRGAQILIVEDNVFDQEFTRELLELQGACVDLAGNGAEAVAKVTSGMARYHAVLMDVKMPIMDGMEATRRIRRDPLYQKLPIIALTSGALDQDRERCLAAGMNEQIGKPVDVAALYAVLEKSLKESGFVPVPKEGLRLLLPEHLPGIDVMQALKTLESEPLLLKLLISFGRENESTLDQLREALAEGERQAARRIVHTVKGVSANVGALELSRAALALEKVLSEEELPVAPLQDFEEKLGQVLESVATLKRPEEGLPPQEEGGRGVIEDREKVAPIFARLASLLEADNLTALELWDEVRPHVQGVTADRLAAALEVLDFRSASKHLAELAQVNEISL